MKAKRMVLVCSLVCFGLTGCDIPHQSRIKDEPFVIDNTYKQIKPSAERAPDYLERSQRNEYYLQVPGRGPSAISSP